MIGIIGLSHKSAPVQIREKLAIPKESIPELSKLILANKYIEELVVLSTCNRTELYFKADECCSTGAFSMVMKGLQQFTGEESSLSKYFYHYGNDQAVNHLFRVVSSLESMVLGEYQIVSQLKEAFQIAIRQETVGKVLKRLFNKALETGKDVRTQTQMSTGAFSVSYAAVEKCHDLFKNLEDKKILLIGAGETGELVIKNLHKKGCKQITVVNRTRQKADELARRYEGKSLPFSKLTEGIHQSEIIVSSVSSKQPILNAEKITPALNGFPQVMMIDLGVPRNIHPDVTDIPGISLLNVDDLTEVVAGNREKKETYISTAEKIIAQKVDEFSDWLSAQNLSPAIRSIMSAINQISESELSAFSRFHANEDHELVNSFRQQMSSKLINSMIKNLKDISDNGRKTEYIKIINDLFAATHD